MTTNDASTGIARDLSAAIDELSASLERASGAAATIRTLVPKIGAIGSVLDELETLIHSGRQQIGAAPGEGSPAVFARPTLVVPSAPAERPAPAWQPEPEIAFEAAPAPRPIEPAAIEDTTAWHEPAATNEAEPGDAEPATANEDLVCFRLEFESRPGPLDLRTVDDAVSEHPAVRDVALLDYDGRKATLKVWIVSTASPADVQQSLTESASALFNGGNDVTIVALEDVA
jgi:hypothetical protein